MNPGVALKGRGAFRGERERGSRTFCKDERKKDGRVGSRALIYVPNGGGGLEEM